jgi:cell division protein FtsQ
MLKRILNISLWVLLCGGLLCMLSFVEKHKEDIMCKGVDVSIDYSQGNFFISEQDVKTMFSDLGYTSNLPLKNINIHYAENLLNSHPSVEKADVYLTIDGKLKTQIKQRTPLVRVFSEAGDSYYIDNNATLMPVSEQYTSRVLIATGNIPIKYADKYKLKLNSKAAEKDTSKETTILKEIYTLSNYISQNEFWKAQIKQIYVNQDKELELIPLVGNQTILFGNTSDMIEKFEKLLIFYKKGINNTGWNNYSEINLKFKNQVICKKVR